MPYTNRWLWVTLNTQQQSMSEMMKHKVIWTCQHLKALPSRVGQRKLQILGAELGKHWAVVQRLLSDRFMSLPLPQSTLTEDWGGWITRRSSESRCNAALMPDRTSFRIASSGSCCCFATHGYVTWPLLPCHCSKCLGSLGNRLLHSHPCGLLLLQHPALKFSVIKHQAPERFSGPSGFFGIFLSIQENMKGY